MPRTLAEPRKTAKVIAVVWHTLARVFIVVAVAVVVFNGLGAQSARSIEQPGELDS